MASSNLGNADHLHHANGKLTQRTAHSNSSSNSITNIWHNRNLNSLKQQQARNRSSTPRKNLESSFQEDHDRIVMSKKQLMEFTKKFAMHKIDYQEEIQNLKQDCEDKSKRIQIFEEQNVELRIQQDYLMKVMEQLRDRHINEIANLNSKNQSLVMMKQGQIDHLSQQIIKVREWLEEEKLEAKRCIQFFKIKDEIIQNSEWELLKYKSQIKSLKQINNQRSALKNFHTNSIKITQNSVQRKKDHSNKKIILKRKEDYTSNKQNSELKRKSQNVSKFQSNDEMTRLTSLINTLRSDKIQVQNQKFQIFSKYRQATIQNDTLKKRVQKLQKQKGQENKIKKSIHQLDQITKRIKQSQVDKENLLATKCLFLQKHIEKLAKELSDVKTSQILAISKFSEQFEEHSFVINT